MPGPFPGMDPYLESPAFWKHTHESVIYNLSALLNANLPAGYAAQIGERSLLIQPNRTIFPDVAVLRHDLPLQEFSSGGTATAVVEDAPVVLSLLFEEEVETYIEIVTTQHPQRVVTAIEVLSPANKTAGSDGYEQYRRKQSQVLGSETHLLEIDLLRQGSHTVAPSRALLNALGAWSYVVSLSRSGQRGQFEVWARTVRDLLPRVRIPLDTGVPDTILDLQAAFNSAYDAGPYRRRINYAEEPEIALSPQDAVWADALLREKGLRP